MKNIIDILYNELKLDINLTSKRGFPYIGRRQDGKEFSNMVKSIEEAWYFYDYELYNLENNNEIIKLGSGDPIRFKPYPGAIKEIKKALKTEMYQYGPAAGDESLRQILADYLIDIGFNKNITFNNVIPTMSTTDAFSLILKSIFRPYDVIIMTSPCYGLFAFMPERLNINVESIKLEEEDNYLINSSALNKLIININKELKQKYNYLDYVPRVRAFLNINPHNPLGTVIGNKERNILNELGEVAIKNDIFIIDDLIYRDLSYDRNNLAKPLGTIDKYFDYSISMFGLSKSYAMANTRSGLIVANDKIISLIRNNVFYNMDSSSILQLSALCGVFNNSQENKREYKKYFNDIIKKYIYKRDLSLALINGIESIKNSEYYISILKEIRNNSNLTMDEINKGIPYAKVDIIPESGFFMIVDFTELKNHSNIKTEKQLLEHLYINCGVKFLVGQSISWPKNDKIIMRITYALENSDIIKSLSRINKEVKEIIYETN